MAEKYGTVPPRFTKEWWEYFWMYYKGYVIGIGFLLIALVITVYQVATRPHYDTTIMYAGAISFPEEVSEYIENEVSQLCDDTDNNGEKAVMFNQLNISVGEDPEYSVAMSEKLYLTLAADEVYLYILDAEVAHPYLEEGSKSSVFIPLSEWCEKDIADDKIYSVNGTAFGINVTESEIFKKIAAEHNANFSDAYIFMRYQPRKDQKEQEAGYKAATKLARRLIGDIQN